MHPTDLLQDAFGRIRELVDKATVDLTGPELAFRPDADANSIAWLVWHLTRVQDDHLSEILGEEQAWTSQDWGTRFGLPFAPAATGYGHSTQDVAEVRPEDPHLLQGYHEAVFQRTVAYLSAMPAEDLDRIIDESWDPPVTVGVRLVSVLSDNLQHAGQALYVRGVVERR